MNNVDLAEVASLAGDPARAAMLAALMDGRALTAKELAFSAHVTASTASAHLRRLTEARLLSVVRQGRHAYFCVASPLVAQMLEAIAAVAAMQTPPRRRPAFAKEAPLRELRMCYDHLAGRVAVAIADAMVRQGSVRLDADGGEVTAQGVRLLERLGVDAHAPQGRRAFCRPCLDWSERRFHLAGQVGAALARHMLNEGWLRRAREGRVVVLTDLGRSAVQDAFGVSFPAGPDAPAGTPVYSTTPMSGP